MLSFLTSTTIAQPVLDRAIPILPPVTLPIDALLPELLASLRETHTLVLEAPPGAGKTTRVPAALLAALPGQILVLEPRRLAARLAARRVAEELNQPIGELVGYQVRFEDVTTPQTRLRFMTEGILTRRLERDPDLTGVDAVVLDEFHERHLEGDLALALLTRLQRRRLQGGQPALKLIVMSATLDAGSVATFLQAPVLRSAGRAFPLTVEHLPYSPEELPQQVVIALARLLTTGNDGGNILVFLPGQAEIRRAQRACEPLARQHGLLVFPLHGELSPAEQDLAVSPSKQRKLILSTNVAESSVTVAGVTAVIDSGLARIASHNPWTGLPTLEVARISQASARQRAGRAGRTAPGRVLRLYPEDDFLRRPEQDLPEIARADLAQLLLTLRAMGLPDPAALTWLDPPPHHALEAASDLLHRLQATGTTLARMARLPLAPRLARIVIAAEDGGIAALGCRAVALLSSGARIAQPDLLNALDQPLDPRSAQVLRQLQNTFKPRPTPTPKDPEEALLRALLTGFPDRVARRRAGKSVLLSTGLSAELAGEPPRYPFMLVLDVEDRKEGAQPQIRLTARTEPDWLLEFALDADPERITERRTPTWHRTGERVELLTATLYDQLVLEESSGPAPPAEAAALLAQKALELGIHRFVDPGTLELLEERLRFAGLAQPDLPAPLTELCAGLTSFAQLREAAARSFLPLLESKVDTRLLAELAPATLRLGNGRPTAVHYQAGRTPWISARLQDFFGLKDTPRIGPAQLPVVVHLLAPNGRDIQTTTDLAGFWARLYPEVRPGLARRYPKHNWPEQKPPKAR